MSTSDTNNHAPQPQPKQPLLQRTTSTSSVVDSRFSCNICFDAVVEPVVTQCGHLYCWPCLYRWLEPGMYPEERASLGLALTTNAMLNTDSSRRVCPVCKSACSVPTLVPIYVRSSNEQTSRSKQQIPESTTEPSSASLGSVAKDVGVSGSTIENNVSIEARCEDISSRPHPSSQDRHEQEPQQDEEYVVRAIEISSTSLRQRRRNPSQSRNTSNGDQNQPPASTDQPPSASAAAVPNRPAASSPRPSTNQHRNQGSYNNISVASGSSVNPNWMANMSPNGGTTQYGSLTHGILLSFQQAGIHLGDTNESSGRNPQQQSDQRSIPSLHNIRDGSVDVSQQQQPYNIDVNSETTQYLSRLLIMLTSFVILCLLLL